MIKYWEVKFKEGGENLRRAIWDVNSNLYARKRMGVTNL